MNYNFAFTAAEFMFNPPPHNISATEFDAKLREMRGLYPKGVAYVTQNLFGSHDANRIGSHIVNRGIGNFRDWVGYFQLSQVGSNPDGSKRPADKVPVNETLQQHYRKMIQLRNRLPALQPGDFSTLLTDNDKALYGFERRYQQQVTLSRDQLNWQEQIDQLPVTVSGHKIRLTIPAKWSAVLLAQ